MTADNRPPQEDFLTNIAVAHHLAAGNIESVNGSPFKRSEALGGKPTAEEQAQLEKQLGVSQPSREEIQAAIDQGLLKKNGGKYRRVEGNTRFY